MARQLSNRDGGKTSESGHLHLVKALLNGATFGGSWLVAQQGTPNMTVQIAIGDGLIDSGSGYSYQAFTDAVESATIATADASNPRNDIVVAYIDKSVVSSATTNNVNALAFKAVTGTPNAVPVDPNAAAIQSSVGAGNPYTLCARVRVSTAATTITTAMIDDLRTGVSLGSNSVVTASIADNNVTASKLATNAITLGYAQITSAATAATLAQVTGLTVTVTIPAGGRKIKITAYSDNLSGGTVNTQMTIWDGVVGSGTRLQNCVTSGAAGNPGTAIVVVTPSAGSKTYNIGLMAGGGGTASLDAGATNPAFILVEAI